MAIEFVLYRILHDSKFNYKQDRWLYKVIRNQHQSSPKFRGIRADLWNLSPSSILPTKHKKGQAQRHKERYRNTSNQTAPPQSVGSIDNSDQQRDWPLQWRALKKAKEDRWPHQAGIREHHKLPTKHPRINGDQKRRKGPKFKKLFQEVTWHLRSTAHESWESLYRLRHEISYELVIKGCNRRQGATANS